MNGQPEQLEDSVDPRDERPEQLEHPVDERDEAFYLAIAAGEKAHLLTVGSPARGLCLRVTKGRLSRRGVWHSWQPDIFFIWRGKRL